MLFRIAAILLLPLMSVSVYAISNIETQRPGPPPEGWSGHVEFSASGKSGDVDEDRYALGGRLGFRTGSNTVFGVLQSAQTRAQGVKTADESFAHLRGIHQHSDRVASEAFVQFQENEFASLLSRYLAGGGARVALLSREDVVSVYMGLGVFHEWEKTDLRTFTERRETWRLNNYWSVQHKLNEQVNWYSTVYLQPNLDDAEDYRALLDAGLRVRLTGSLHLRVSYNLRHNSSPPRNLLADPVVDRAKTNRHYLTSFMYEF
jgi:putative salt-induced outer membrane protein YdiY